MSDPIDLSARRGERTPQPEGPPDIEFYMDEDRITFRDKATLDTYVNDALGWLLAEAWDEGYQRGLRDADLQHGADNPYEETDDE